MMSEIGGYIADNNPFVRIRYRTPQLALRYLGANRVPPGASGRLMDREVCIGCEIKREDFLQYRFFVVGLDSQRPVEVFDRTRDVPLLGIAGTKHHDGVL